MRRETFTGGGYSVTVASDGSIRVKQGDSLSKYSMAIKGNFKHVNEFCRKINGKLEPISNINRIVAGETIYYKPFSKMFGVPTSPNSNVAGQPKPFPQDGLRKIKINSKERLFVDVNVSPLQAGQVWMAADGRRIILAVSSAAAVVVYLLEKPGDPNHLKTFIQDGSEFYLDVKNWYVEEVGRKVEPLKTVIEWELALMLGFVSCLSTPAFLIVSGVSLLEFIVTNWNWLSRVKDALRVSYEVHTFLSTHTPVLYKKVVFGMFHKFIENVPNIVGHIPEAVLRDPKLMLSALGVFLGKMAAFENGKMLMFTVKNKFAIAFLVLSMLLTVVAKAIQAVPGATVITVEEKLQYATEIVKKLRSQGVSISKAEAETIIDEVIAHPEVQTHLERLKNAFEATQ